MVRNLEISVRLKIHFTQLLPRVCFIVAESMYPRFAEPIPNVTVTVGRDALLACVVENLRGFKVNSHKTKYSIFGTNVVIDIRNIRRNSQTVNFVS